MKPHVERMINEQNELEEKIAKLTAFISSNPLFDNLPKEERIDMRLQLEAMRMYATILSVRISRSSDNE